MPQPRKRKGSTGRRAGSARATAPAPVPAGSRTDAPAATGPASPAGTATSTRPAARATPAPGSSEHWMVQYAARAEAKNAEARAQLVPLAPDEHPWALRIAIGMALVFSLGTLVLMVAGVKVDGKPPATSWIFYVAVMLACAIGMWRHWFQAVLAFMCLLAIALVVLCALLLRFSNLLGFLIPLLLIAGGGTLFWKLVRVLARLQMPERPVRASRG